MNIIEHAHKRISVPAVPRRRFIVASGASLIMIAVALSFGDASVCSVASQNDCASLYQRHCSTCHIRALKARSHKEIVENLRIPPPGMPAFGEDRVSDLDAWAIVKYLYPAAARETTAATAAPAAAEQVPGRSDHSMKKPPKAGKPDKTRRDWLKDFGTSGD